jgi:hypothetical protein
LPIPIDSVSAVKNVQVRTAISDEPDLLKDVENLTMTDTGDAILVEWTYPTTQSGDTRIFQLDYDLIGALWVYPDGDFLSWNAIDADRGGVDVEQSTIVVDLPPELPAELVTANGDAPDIRISSTEKQITLKSGEALADGTPFNIALSWPHGLLPAEVQPWQRQEDLLSLDFEIDRFYADLTLRPDGLLEVHEQISLSILNGFFYDGFRPLPLLYMDSISGITVSQDDRALNESGDSCTNCYSVVVQAHDSAWIAYSSATDEVAIDPSRAGRSDIFWSLEGLRAGEQALFDIRYVVHGAIRTESDKQILTWDVIPEYDVPIRNISATLRLPPGVDSSQISSDSSVRYTESDLNENEEITLTYDGEVQPRSRWQLTFTLPENTTTATKPVWQSELEAAIDKQNSGNGLAGMVVGIAGLAILVVSIFFAWRHWGRRRQE